jgi:hypothetical protein
MSKRPFDVQGREEFVINESSKQKTVSLDNMED